MGGWCLKSTFKNQCPLSLLFPFFQPPEQDEQNGKHCHLLPKSFRISLKDTSSNISIDSTELSSLHDLRFSHKRIISQTNYIPTWLRKIFKFMWKMDLQIKNLKLDISTTPRQNSLPSL